VISFRYHVVTVVAVFLALALGLLAGGAFVQPGLVDQLRNQTDSQLGTIADLRKQVGDLRAQAAGLEAFSEAALSHLTQDRLAGSSVVLVAQEGVEDAVVTEARQHWVKPSHVVALSARSSPRPRIQRHCRHPRPPERRPEDLLSSAGEALADRPLDGRRAPGDPDVPASCSTRVT
jgi:hypothetical protein